MRLAVQRIAETAAARRVETENVARFQRMVGKARRQALFVFAARIDADIAGAARQTAADTLGPDHMPHRTDRKTRVRTVEIFAADAEPAAEFSGTAGIADQLETQQAGR